MKYSLPLDPVYAQVSEDLNIPVDRVRKVYKAFWRAVHEYVSSQPLKENLSDDEFMKLRPNVNIPSLGKLYVTLDRYHGIKKKDDYYIQKKKEQYERTENK